MEYDIEKLIIGIGGSATNDAGVGMAQALGAKFLDENNEEISFGGGELDKIKQIDLTEIDFRLEDIEVEVACDVDNPLYGSRGAAHVYGPPQKGADSEMVNKLDKHLRYFNQLIRDKKNIDLQEIRGSGAAGGLGGGLVVFLGADLRPGIEIIIEENRIEEKMSDLVLVITGEGKMDGQSIQGKTPVGVAQKAGEKDIPTIVIAGEIVLD